MLKRHIRDPIDNDYSLIASLTHPINQYTDVLVWKGPVNLT